MNKVILFLIYSILSFTCYSQVGIRTLTPGGTLEVSSGDEAKLGLVLPIVAKLEDVEHVIAGEPVKRGTIIFDEQRNSICYKKIDGWNCFNGDIIPDALYIKASNTGFNDNFGYSVALSTDGNTLAVAAPTEASNATGINGDQTNNSSLRSGAVYIFTRTKGTTWSQQAYIKASNTDVDDDFGGAIALSADGNTLAVGAIREASNATGINGNQNDNSFIYAGAVYVFTRSETTWSQQAYIKASNTDANDYFGNSVNLSADGNTLAIGAYGEASNETGINGDENNNSAEYAGAAYVFTRSGTTWSQQAYIKASNTDANDYFGQYVVLTPDGNTLAVAANGEKSNATGVNGNQDDNSFIYAGAVYVFTRSGTTWSQQAYIKASNTNPSDRFGSSVKLSDDGNTLVVGAYEEASNATGINGDENNNSTLHAGAVYVFTRSGTIWSQQAYIKASNTQSITRSTSILYYFGYTVSLTGDGNTLAVGAYGESSNAKGTNGDQTNHSAEYAGAVYIFKRSGTTWTQHLYLKAPNTDAEDRFGFSVALSANGNALTVGAPIEASNATGIDGDQTNNSTPNAGAVYVYNLKY